MPELGDLPGHRVEHVHGERERERNSGDAPSDVERLERRRSGQAARARHLEWLPRGIPVRQQRGVEQQTLEMELLPDHAQRSGLGRRRFGLQRHPQKVLDPLAVGDTAL